MLPVVQTFALPVAKCLGDPGKARRHAFPKIFPDDPKFRLLNYTPLAFRAVAPQSLVGAGLLHESGPVPYDSTDVEVTAKHLTYGGGAPRRILFSSARARRRNVFTIQSLGDCPERTTIGSHSENSLHNRRFRGIDLQSDTAAIGHVVVAITSTASVEALKRASFQATVRLFGEFFDIERIHQAVHRHQHIGLLILGIDALRNRNDPDAHGIQLLAYTIVTPGSPDLLAEEVQSFGFSGSPGASPAWLPPAEALNLLRTARPEANVSPGERREPVQELLDHWEDVRQALDPLVTERAKTLEAAHRRVRASVQLASRGMSVAKHFPPDLLGALVLLPVPKGVLA